MIPFEPAGLFAKYGAPGHRRMLEKRQPQVMNPSPLIPENGTEAARALNELLGRLYPKEP